MAFHLPIVAALGVGAGVVHGVVAAYNGGSAKEAFKKGLDTTTKIASVASLGLISQDAGIDMTDNGQIAYNPGSSNNNSSVG